MAATNIANTTKIYGKTLFKTEVVTHYSVYISSTYGQYYSPAGTGSILTNPINSGQVFKINLIRYNSTPPSAAGQLGNYRVPAGKTGANLDCTLYNINNGFEAAVYSSVDLLLNGIICAKLSSIADKTTTVATHSDWFQPEKLSQSNLNGVAVGSYVPGYPRTITTSTAKDNNLMTILDRNESFYLEEGQSIHWKSNNLIDITYGSYVANQITHNFIVSYEILTDQ